MLVTVLNVNELLFIANTNTQRVQTCAKADLVEEFRSDDFQN